MGDMVDNVQEMGDRIQVHSYFHTDVKEMEYKHLMMSTFTQADHQRWSTKIFFLFPPSSVPLSSVPSVPVTEEVASVVTGEPTPSPPPRSSHTHAHRCIGPRNATSPTAPSARLMYLSVSDRKVASTPSPLPSPLDTTFPCSN
jgi:hypothetical protein